MMKKGLLTGVLALSLLQVSASAEGATTFTDMQDHWANKDVATAVQKGYIDGYEDNTFRPEIGVTKAEYIKMVVTAQKLKVPVAGKDVPWYEPYHKVAVEKGLITPTEFPLDQINNQITRLEMSKISLRASNSKFLKEEIIDGLALYESAKVGLLQGRDEKGSLAPLDQTTRAQSVTVIERVLALNDGKTLPLDKYAVSNAEIEWHKTNAFTMLPQYFLRDYLDRKIDFDLRYFRYEGANGFSEVIKYVVIDLDDPNDPNWDLIKDRQMGWRFNFSSPFMEGIGEYPTNAYALISLNRLVVDSPESKRIFRTGGLYISYDGESEALKAEGKPWRLGIFSEYYPKYSAFYQSEVFDLPPGHSDITYIYGQFLPKGELKSQRRGDAGYVNVYSRSASELGEANSPFIYGSKVDYSLAKEW